MAAPARLYPLRWHGEQARLMASPARFAVVPAGRRSGKTENAKRKLVVRALQARGRDPRFFAGAPTRDQAKRIFWSDLKAMFPAGLVAETREGDLMLRLVTGTEVWVLGMDRPERVEGSPWDGGVLDEVANMKPGTWGENVRPALSDRKGWCWLIGVPEGRNHYYDLWRYARDSGDPEWDGFTWKSIEILDAAEVEAARRQLDALVFEQEYEASFVNFEGRAYYPFQEAIHCRALEYNDRAPIAFCFDFNVEPGVAAIVQEQALPGQFERGADGLVDLARPVIGTGVIGEVHIPRNSNTPAVCRRLIADWGEHQGAVRCYGDATGGARGTAKVAGSDWDLIRDELRAHFGERLAFKVPEANPPERARVNAMNSRLLSRDGTVRLMVDGQRAPHVVKDLEGVRTLAGGSGEIDKKATPALTHMCFAAGTRVELDGGPCAIEDAPATGLVRTWNGSFVPFENVGRTRLATPVVAVCLSNGERVVCTPDHQWLTEEGWEFAAKLIGRNLRCHRSSSSRPPAKISTARHSGGTTGRVGISAGHAGVESSTCTASSTRTSSGRFRPARTFTIATGTAATTLLRISKRCSPANIFATTKRLILQAASSLVKQDSRRPEKRPSNGMPAKPGISGIANMLCGIASRCAPRPSPALASAAGLLSWPNAPRSSAPNPARRPLAITRESITSRAAAPAAGPSSRPTATREPATAADRAQQPLAVLDVRPAGSMDVYCLHVPTEGCFALACGVIVSNSDSLGYYVHREFPIVRQGMSINMRSATNG